MDRNLVLVEDDRHRHANLDHHRRDFLIIVVETDHLWMEADRCEGIVHRSEEVLHRALTDPEVIISDMNVE